MISFRPLGLERAGIGTLVFLFMLELMSMIERSLGKGTKSEDVGGIHIEYASNWISVLRNSIKLPKHISMSDYAFSNKDILYTTGVTTCCAIVVKRGKTWGLFHDVVYPESRNWVYDSHRERLFEFLEKINGINNEDESDFALLFGNNRAISEKLVESRIEAEKVLMSIANFKKNKIICRWNNDGHKSSVSVLINPVQSHIYVESVFG